MEGRGAVGGRSKHWVKGHSPAKMANGGVVVQGSDDGFGRSVNPSFFRVLPPVYGGLVGRIAPPRGEKRLAPGKIRG